MIDSKTLDPDFKLLIAREPGGEHIKRCFSCGTCTAGCPVREVTDRYNPRKIIRMAILGMKKGGPLQSVHLALLFLLHLF